MSDLKFPFVVYSLDERGINLVTTATPDPITSQGVTLLVGESYETTEEVFRANTNRLGESWLSWSDEEQAANWGRVRLARGELPADVAARLDAEKKARLEQQRNEILAANPSLAIARSSALRLAALDRELAEK